MLSMANNASGIAVVAMSIALVSAALHVLLETVLIRVSPAVRTLSVQARSDLMLQLMWLLCCAPLPFLYAAALPALCASAEGRWHGTSLLVEWALLLHVGSSLYEMGVYIKYSKPLVYTLHHLVVIYAYGLGAYVGTHHFWGAWAGLVELSNFNVCFLKISLILGAFRGSKLEVANGALLYCMYVCVRILSLPCLLALYVHDITRNYNATWGSPCSHSVLAVRVTTPVCVLAIWIVSCVWFAPIHKGMLKVLRGADLLEGQHDNLTRNFSALTEQRAAKIS